jgi:hypothetical protein
MAIAVADGIDIACEPLHTDRNGPVSHLDVAEPQDLKAIVTTARGPSRRSLESVISIRQATCAS